MKTFTKSLFAVIAAVMSVGCAIQPPDFFVPDVVFAEAPGDVNFDTAGSTRTLSIEANCDWTIFCPADWVDLSVTEGDQNGSVVVTVGPSKLDRVATVTVTSNEVSSRTSEIRIVQTGVKEISSVETPVALNLTTAEGTTASFSSLYSGLKISETDEITGGFTLTPAGGGAALEFTAVVDKAAQSLRYDATGLVPEQQYTCTAWVKLNSDAKVVSSALTFATVVIPPTVTLVTPASVTGAKSDAGTTASFSAGFETVSVKPSNIITAGFSVSPQVGGSSDIDAVVSGSNFSADVTGLTPGTEYTVTAWARLDGGEKVEAVAVKFTPAIAIPVTISVDFTTAVPAEWGLPGKQEDMKQEAVNKTIGDYTWTIYAGALNGGSLWLASVGKKGYEGYIQSQKLEGLTVRSIHFPNDGQGLSGSARVTVLVSTDGGETFNPIPGCVGVDIRMSQRPLIELPSQPEGCVYRIQNVDVNGTNGFSKTKVMTFNAVR